MPKFSKASLKKLNNVHPRLRYLLHNAIKIYDFTILCGYRNKIDQNRAYNDKKSRVKWPNSKHNKKPYALAVDISPWPIDWKNYKAYYFLGGIIKALAKIMEIPIRWGGDWQGDNNFKNDTFLDLGHFELIEGGQEMAGIKETKEALIGGNELGIYLVKRLKDGADISDAFDIVKKLLTDSEFKDIIKKAFDGAKNIPEEIKDLNFDEGIELAKLQMEFTPRWVEAFKKEE